MLIHTASGKCVDLESFTEDDVDIFDIAHSLSNTCRFNGATGHFYSVAEHCYHCSNATTDARIAFLGLIHDATEAYIGDIVKPIKDTLPEIKSLESKLFKTICNKYNFSPSPEEIVKVTGYDLSLLVYEANKLLGVDLSHLNPPYSFSFEFLKGWSPIKIRTLYLRTFHALHSNI